MKRTIYYIFFALFLAGSAAAQGRSIDVIKKQIRDLKTDKEISIVYDQDSNTTKMMAISENFKTAEVDCTGAKAINFAIAFTFSGKNLVNPPETVNLTFWVLTRKPQFVDSHHWRLTGGDAIDLGDARYAARPADSMEYLNFVVSRGDLSRIAKAGTAFQLGKCNFTFTQDQSAMLAALVALSKP